MYKSLNTKAMAQNNSEIKERIKVDVQFRVLRDEVIAVFPYEIFSITDVMSYVHMGQHIGCAWYINTFTKPASEEQYKDLLKELQAIGYDVNIIKRRNHSKYLEAYDEIVKNSR